MDITPVIDELRDNLKREELKTQNYIQGYSDAIGEAMYLLEKYAAKYKKSEISQ